LSNGGHATRGRVRNFSGGSTVIAAAKEFVGRGRIPVAIGDAGHNTIQGREWQDTLLAIVPRASRNKQEDKTPVSPWVNHPLTVTLSRFKSRRYLADSGAIALRRGEVQISECLAGRVGCQPSRKRTIAGALDAALLILSSDKPRSNLRNLQSACVRIA
jgi:hypothetical protein